MGRIGRNNIIYEFSGDGGAVKRANGIPAMFPAVLSIIFQMEFPAIFLVEFLEERENKKLPGGSFVGTCRRREQKIFV